MTEALPDTDDESPRSVTCSRSPEALATCFVARKRQTEERVRSRQNEARGSLARNSEFEESSRGREGPVWKPRSLGTVLEASRSGKGSIRKFFSLARFPGKDRTSGPDATESRAGLSFLSQLPYGEVPASVVVSSLSKVRADARKKANLGRRQGTRAGDEKIRGVHTLSGLREYLGSDADWTKGTDVWAGHEKETETSSAAISGKDAQEVRGLEKEHVGRSISGREFHVRPRKEGVRVQGNGKGREEAGKGHCSRRQEVEGRVNDECSQLDTLLLSDIVRQQQLPVKKALQEVGPTECLSLPRGARQGAAMDDVDSLCIPLARLQLAQKEADAVGGGVPSPPRHIVRDGVDVLEEAERQMAKMLRADAFGQLNERRSLPRTAKDRTGRGGF